MRSEATGDRRCLTCVGVPPCGLAGAKKVGATANKQASMLINDPIDRPRARPGQRARMRARMRAGVARASRARRQRRLSLVLQKVEILHTRIGVRGLQTRLRRRRAPQRRHCTSAMRAASSSFRCLTHNSLLLGAAFLTSAATTLCRPAASGERPGWQRAGWVKNAHAATAICRPSCQARRKSKKEAKTGEQR